jgi:hypothetical protein
MIKIDFDRVFFVIRSIELVVGGIKEADLRHFLTTSKVITHSMWLKNVVKNGEIFSGFSALALVSAMG